MNNKRDDILFLSGIYPEQLYNELTNLDINSNIQFAADVLQKHIISGLDFSINNPIKLINAPYIGVFPFGSKIMHFKKTTFSHCINADDVNIQFFNIPLIRHFSIYNSSKHEIRQWIKKHSGGTVMAYALTLRNVCSLLYAKRLDKTIKTCMIVPDLPLYMRMSAGYLYRFAKNIENHLIFSNLHKIDSFVLLTKHMNNIIKSKNYCVMEGIATRSTLVCKTDESVKVILYTGTLDSKYGINNLLQSFHQIKDQNVCLYICGTGDSQTEVERMVKIDDRIRYFGSVSREKALQLQSEASLLVNPRQNVGEYTKYSFPSKNLEYLSSGVPLVAYKLDGISDEYDPYIFYVRDNTVEALQETIEKVLTFSKRDRDAFGEKAREFVLNNKNEVVQAKKILDMIRSK